ncbi:30S ribosomal protein S17 [Candidatus Nasuia deltocephalinicola]|nr:30S ribosomal protein S17 [Candidatus Nasuia deltocephalinicola]
MNKTIVVLVIRLYKHYKYNKYLKKYKKYNVHDEYNLAFKNDYVEFIYFRPLSKTKFWILIKILK